ncbi:UNVERIFIED_CONTAM: hypothetical protein FKN15_041667 [Acipenser sinensis]
MAGRSCRAWFSVLLGLVVGFTLASFVILPRATELKNAGPKRASTGGCGLQRGLRRDYSGAQVRQPQQDNGLLSTDKPVPRSKNFLFVGVMTAQKYLDNRVVAAHRTWAQTIPGKVAFFSSEGSDLSLPIPVVALDHVDDSYPPQKKSFMMIKYMHDHFLNQYEWFMRADDDVYIKSDRLESFLRSLNSSEALFLGQTGMGARDELGKLALEPGENFCMGGPGVIMSREVLRRMVPHIKTCLQEMYTTHEDVEVGRCVRRFAGVQCAWSYEHWAVGASPGGGGGISLRTTRHGTRNNKHGIDHLPTGSRKAQTVGFYHQLFLENKALTGLCPPPTQSSDQINQDSGSLSFLSNSLKMLVPFKLGGTNAEYKEPKETKINILVPLSGRYEIFVRFMANFEKTCLIPNQNVKLLLLLFSTDNNTEKMKQVELMREYHMKYPKADMEIKSVSGPFSRALALDVGSSRFSNDSLLFYCDVDLLFTADFMKRCRSNTILGEQSYFPIIFSQYDPKVVYAGKVQSDNHYVFTLKTGLWRHYGFGITCVYKGDLIQAGGFDVGIQGWGLEDVDLFNKFVQSGIKIFRSTDIGIVHVHHAVICDPNLDPKQYKMCLGSKASSHGSTQQLAELWLEKNDPSFQRISNNNNGSMRTS